MKTKDTRPSAKADSKKRLNIILPDASWDRLERLKVELEAETITEVVKDSFRLLEYIVDLSKAGATFQVKTPDGQIKGLELFRITTPKS